MTNIPVEDRLALQDLMTDNCYAVDKLGDVAGRNTSKFTTRPIVSSGSPQSDNRFS
ncbi:hypothetical protein [Sphingomonas sp.]|uniref:hypothetical protein n=1 Tax=Sphingomonas sp. TaxID=28214 RepID=UPI003750AD5A